MARIKTQKSSTVGIMAAMGGIILAGVLASTFNSCATKKSSETVTVAAVPPTTPTPTPTPNPNPNPGPGAIQNAWVALNNINPPAARASHSAIWSGTRMIIWGGTNGTSALADGASFDPQNGTWTLISATGAPSARFGHEAVWDGTRMIVWGGTNGTTYFNDGAAYNPATNTWAPLTGTMIAARAGHSAVYTGQAMLVWGGGSTVQPTGYSDGGYYVLNLGWTTLTGADPILKRIGHSSIWTGTSMIMFGGTNNNITSQDGFIFTPNNNTFTFLALSANTPANRQEHSAAWDGAHMIVWGGLLQGITTSYYADGRIYDLASNTWSVMNNTGAPTARAGHSAVWAGDAMIVWGGMSGTSPLTYYNNGAVFH